MSSIENEVEKEDVLDFIRENKKSIILTFLIGAVIVFIVSALAGLEDIVNVLKRTNYWFLALSFILEAAIILVWTLRWKMILDLIDESPKFTSLMVMLFASLFGNNITPGAAGGEPLRAYILREVKGTPFEIGFASSTADRVFEFLPFVIISVLAAILILTWNISIWTRIFVTLLIILCIIFFSVVIYKEVSFAEVSEKLIFYINRFTTGFAMALKDRKVLLIGFVLSFGMWGLDIIRFYICFLAIGVQPPLLPLVIIYTVGILISLLPLIPGSLGIREATLVGLFAVAGISADFVVAASVIDRLGSYIIPTIIGAFSAFYYGKIIVSEKKPKSVE